VAKKNSPHIFFAAGVAGVVGGTVLACKATLKLEKTLDEIQADIEKVKSTTLEISDQERNRLLALKYGRGGIKLVKLYTPAIIVGGASIGLLAGSHVQLTRRNSALSATLALVSKSFDDYRERVRAEVGEERENDLYRCMEDNEIEVDGKKHKLKTISPKGLSPYARCFDAVNSKEWQPNSELNRMFIQCQQNYANHKLQAYGVVMLNDVYDSLGMDRTSAGAVVGWVLNGDGDGYVDFGMFTRPEGIPFVLGDEYDVWLDFNVDGEVFRLIDKAVGKR